MRVENKRIKGLIAAPFTPMDVQGNVDTSIIPAYYSLLKSNGVSGVFICGSTGEGASLTKTEKMKLIEAWQDCAASDISFKVIVLVGGDTLRDVEELAAFAESKKIDAISFTAPSYFNPQSVDILVDCCELIASRASRTPFYYYHIPSLTGVHFPMLDLLEKVHGRIENFCGIKYTHEDYMDYLSCLHFEEGQYDILWGRDESFLAALSCGAVGAVGSTFNYAAPLYLSIIDAFERNDLPSARKLQQQSIDMIRLLGKYAGLGTGKAFMRAIGLECGEFRLPVKNIKSSEYKSFLSDLNDLEFQLFSSKMPAFLKI